ncbi:MAG: diguanylate cyclase [Deltaproteobacteria bacterium]|nr:diguanylate cyclase [Deltaproteobacteria bacterium]
MKQKNTLLIVDDDPLNVKLMAKKLSQHQYNILMAYDGETAIAKARAESPDLVLLDIMMPGLSGYEVTEILKKDPNTKDIPIILVTALDGTDDKIKGLEAGADEFLNKPVNTAELLARVKSLLRLKLYQDQLKARVHFQALVASPDEMKKTQADRVNLPTILLVDDCEKEIRLIKGYLQAEAYQIKQASTGEETLSRLLRENIDLVLLDILLPGMDGFEVVRRIREMEDARNVQILAITCLQDMESKVKGISLGADDYLIKPINKHELKVRVKALIRKKAYLDTLRDDYETAVYSAITDKLTGLYNRAYFEHFLKLEIKRADRQKGQVALIMLDIDNFKQCNDTFGHLAGDEILKTLGRLIRENIREIDMAARYGGEEFSIVLPNTDKQGAITVASRICTLVYDHPLMPDCVEKNIRLSVSIGLSVYPSEADTVQRLIQNADRQLYRAKREGKNRVCYVCEPECGGGLKVSSSDNPNF